MLNALTIDVEDYYHVTAFEGRISRRDWDSYPSRVVQNTRQILERLAHHQVRATFFVLGWVAERFPELMREISKGGHELGCHSYWHRMVHEMTAEEFRADLRQARDAIADVVSRPVTAYRAPTFSITRKTLWALDILCEEGFHSDSSIFPIYHDRYGIPDAKTIPHRLTTRSGALWEFPPAVYRLCGVNFPVSGGGYFRLYPAPCTGLCLQRINRRGHPFLFYVHPWELDPEQPALPGSRLARWRHRVNMGSTEQKLDWLLRKFKFGRMSEVLSSCEARVEGDELVEPAVAP